MIAKYGIIDIGSNTIRLVIYEKQSEGVYREVENIKVTARLRKYLESGKLSTEGIALLLHILRQFQESTRFHQLQHVICTATATVRQASNQAYIQALVEQQTDFTLKVLSEYEEAYYGYLAVVNTTSYKEGITVDIGGGSTEVTYFRNRELLHYHSFPFGALSLKQQFIAADVPTSAEYMQLQRFLAEQFQTLSWLKQDVPVIAIGGSARNMVKVYQNIISYPVYGLHQFEMSLIDVETVLNYMRVLSVHELQKLEGLAKDRADTILPAVTVFQSLLKYTGAPSFILSRNGLREGLFFQELTAPLGVPYYPNVLEESFYLLAREYEVDMDRVLELMKHAIMLCEELQACHAATFSQQDLQYMRMAVKVYNIGKYIDEEASSQHTFYLLANKSINGMTHKDRVRLALTASYKSKLSFKTYIRPFETWFTKEEQRAIRLAGAILQLAATLHATKRPVVQSLKVEDRGDLCLHIQCSQTVFAEKIQAEKQKKQLEKVLKRNIELHFYM
ncbi:Ppx/GppA family phosphatase [Ectobacillus sp. JY-23]|uniref:Ppx/GppA family phosphatase n=1 Tax=Ectobacillus sp. JY-23 TaxID=2933872 RepID=UPI001FF1F520|nr:Ppx/GppA family phosphatase [Ectobacillus sp. JY-23]UOY93809.1 Ppx/GppA family phosphatase [Ectobacillus sp. JY-23]